MSRAHACTTSRLSRGSLRTRSPLRPRSRMASRRGAQVPGACEGCRWGSRLRVGSIVPPCASSMNRKRNRLLKAQISRHSPCRMKPCGCVQPVLRCGSLSECFVVCLRLWEGLRLNRDQTACVLAAACESFGQLGNAVGGLAGLAAKPEADSLTYGLLTVSIGSCGLSVYRVRVRG